MGKNSKNPQGLLPFFQESFPKVIDNLKVLPGGLYRLTASECQISYN
ncbi:bifunctional GMP synthase/glutamine amidotransferase protein [Robiginitalea biformata HTCC2501]|uniref:Bifunctional GMP synthase/glutamine amidotransferase protein n=1 Tax=Robiginitalea biformata (strain ATCC BAA-864 / DSM 15991 / KCTC 12146 / HTCC2501) TaxID=313596 RepID=A4CNA6_ROBBH|nr:bifunctional GMP synthase/glutamine amidotransferase protein [Robiginitalea biformata HTCC2501]